MPIGASVHAVLASIPREPDNPWVIAGRFPGTHIGISSVPWTVIRERAGLEDVRIHDLRHTFASRALALGESLPMIGKLLGHTQVQTTARYAHLAREAVNNAASRVAESFGDTLLERKPTDDCNDRGDSAPDDGASPISFTRFIGPGGVVQMTFRSVGATANSGFRSPSAHRRAPVSSGDDLVRLTRISVAKRHAADSKVPRGVQAFSQGSEKFIEHYRALRLGQPEIERSWMKYGYIERRCQSGMQSWIAIVSCRITGPAWCRARETVFGNIAN